MSVYLIPDLDGRDPLSIAIKGRVQVWRQMAEASNDKIRGYLSGSSCLVG